MNVYICPVKDIECGSHKVGWCAGCPKHGTKAADTIEALTAENARLREDHSAIVEAYEDKLDRLREELTARRMLPSERLHNICEAIQAESDGSAFSREEWSRLDAENKTLRSELGSLISKFHHAMKDAGWHPGRTDDSLCDIIREKGKQMVALELEAARYRWIRRKDISMSEHDELMDAVKYRVEDDLDAAIDAARKLG